MPLTSWVTLFIILYTSWSASGANASKTLGQTRKNGGAKWWKHWGKSVKNDGANLQRANNTQSIGQRGIVLYKQHIVHYIIIYREGLYLTQSILPFLELLWVPKSSQSGPCRCILPLLKVLGSNGAFQCFSLIGRFTISSSHFISQ